MVVVVVVVGSSHPDAHPVWGRNGYHVHPKRLGIVWHVLLGRRAPVDVGANADWRWWCLDARTQPPFVLIIIRKEVKREQKKKRLRAK